MAKKKSIFGRIFSYLKNAVNDVLENKFNGNFQCAVVAYNAEFGAVQRYNGRVLDFYIK